MARFLAIDWDEAECRYALATVQKGTVTVRKVGSAPIEVPNDETEGGSLTSSVTELAHLATTLRAVIKEERIDPAPTLVSLGRGKVEMLYQTLPPSRDSEIPALLKNQLLRELSGFSDFDPIDYLILADSTEEGRSVLALTILLVYRQGLVRTLRSIGRAPQKIGFRPIAATELILRSDLAPKQFEPGLIVNVVGNDVDLVLLEGEKIVTLRSFRLPEQLSFADSAQRIATEIERTLTVGNEDFAEESIRKIFLFGTEEDWRPLVELLQKVSLQKESSQKDGLNVVVVNPFELPGIVSATQPEQPGRFAPLLGLLLSHSGAPALKTDIDFLHPREAPKATNYVRAAVLALFLLAICGFGVYHWNQSVVRGMEQELARLESEYKEVATQFQQVRPIWNVLQQTQNWDAQGVSWLDELRNLSITLPGEQDLVVTQMSFATGPINNNPRIAGMIQLSGMVRDPTVLMNLQRQLHAKGIYQMRYPSPSPNPAGGGYPWLFRTTIYRLKTP